jgi:hypothetical protein
MAAPKQTARASWRVTAKRTVHFGALAVFAARFFAGIVIECLTTANRQGRVRSLLPDRLLARVDVGDPRDIRAPASTNSGATVQQSSMAV